MAARARSPGQRRKRAFITRSQGMIRKVKEMHQFKDAKTAVVGIHNGKMFWYDEANVLSQLGIAHEPQNGLTHGVPNTLVPDPPTSLCHPSPLTLARLASRDS